MYKPINKKYFNLGSETEQPYVTWDISDGDEIVFPDLMTMGKVGDTKETLLAEIQKVLDSYEENL